MSLLLKALQRASKSRESAVATPASPAAGRPAAGGAAAAAASTPGRAPGAPSAARDLNFTSRPKGSNLFARATEPADLAEAASAATVDAGALRAERFSVVEWARENPVYVFAIAVLVFLVFYFAYVFLAINYPGIFTRSSGFTAPTGAQIQPLARTSGPTPTGPITAPPPADLPPPPMPSLDLPGRVEPDAIKGLNTAAAPAGTTGTPSPSSTSLPIPPSTPSKSAPSANGVPVAVPANEGSGGPGSGATVSPARSATMQAPDSSSGAVPDSRPMRPRHSGATNSARASGGPAAPRDGAAAETGDRLRVRSTDAGSVISQQVGEAYASLQRGDAARAQSLYESVLAKDHRNVDSLLGLAATAWRQGNSEKASDYYYRVLELEPQNAAAQAGLIGIAGRVDPLASETRLKQLIAREPSGFLYAALGHVHAEQDQWAAAQQAYFQAFQMEPTNPDYAFNLAVGLEHLGQQPLAVGYYRQALELARARGFAGFDRKQVVTRLGKLGAPVE